MEVVICVPRDVPPTRTGTDLTPRDTPISKRWSSPYACVLGLRNETVTRSIGLLDTS